MAQGDKYGILDIEEKNALILLIVRLLGEEYHNERSMGNGENFDAENFFSSQM